MTSRRILVALSWLALLLCLIGVVNALVTLFDIVWSNMSTDYVPIEERHSSLGAYISVTGALLFYYVSKKLKGSQVFSEAEDKTN